MDEQTPEQEVDISKKQEHSWVRRGLVVSCEGANHPTHRHFLTRKVTTPKK